MNDDFLRYVSSLVDYDAESGAMTWKARNESENDSRRWNARYAGKDVGTIDDKGYRRMLIRSFDSKARRIRVHQLAFFMANGRSQIGEIDHINQNKLDNRAENLRDVSKSKNQRNAFMPSNNTSGFTGVTWNKNRLKWEAFATIHGFRHYLGLYVDIHEAAISVSEFRAKNGFTEYHGRPSGNLQEKI